MTGSGAGTPGGTVFLMRHGDSRRDEVRRYVGQSDDPLNEKGREQARWWRGELSAVPFRRAYCSDLTRSRESAGIICAGREELVTPLPELREIAMGEWEGLAMAEVRSAFPRQYEARGMNPDTCPPPGGESFTQLERRVVPVFRDILARAEGPVLVVAHAGVNRVVLCSLLGMPLGNLFLLGQDYGCLNIIGTDSGRVCLDAVNMRPHYALAGMVRP